MSASMMNESLLIDTSDAVRPELDPFDDIAAGGDVRDRDAVSLQLRPFKREPEAEDRPQRMTLLGFTVVLLACVALLSLGYVFLVSPVFSYFENPAHRNASANDSEAPPTSPNPVSTAGVPLRQTSLRHTMMSSARYAGGSMVATRSAVRTNTDRSTPSVLVTLLSRRASSSSVVAGQATQERITRVPPSSPPFTDLPSLGSSRNGQPRPLPTDTMRHPMTSPSPILKTSAPMTSQSTLSQNLTASRLGELIRETAGNRSPALDVTRSIG